MALSLNRVRYFNMGCWPYYVGFTTDPAAFDRECRRLKVKNVGPAIKSGSNAATHFFVNHSMNMAIIAMQPPGRGISRETYAALLAHEAMHVVQSMRENLGDLGSEAEAYIIQQIVLEGLQIAWRTGRTVRRAPHA